MYLNYKKTEFKYLDLKKILNYLKIIDRPLKVKEIRKGVNLKSRQTVEKLLEKLELFGKVKREIKNETEFYRKEKKGDMLFEKKILVEYWSLIE